MFERCAPRLAIPDARACGPGIEEGRSNHLVHKLGGALSRARRSLPQRFKLFLAQIDLALMHVSLETSMTSVHAPVKKPTRPLGSGRTGPRPNFFMALSKSRLPACHAIGGARCPPGTRR